MPQGFKDFDALKELKKELQKQEQAAEPQKAGQNQRSHTVAHKSKEQHAGEQKARELGLQIGSIVTLMDSNDRGILRHVHKDHVDIELDGLMITAGFSEFIVNDPEEERELLRRSGSVRSHKKETVSPSPSSQGEITVDLHIEKIPGGFDAPEGFELPFQMEYFKRVLRQNLKHRGMRINIVHGVGDGVLKDAVRKELDEAFALSCVWVPGPAGVTTVTVK